MSREPKLKVQDLSEYKSAKEGDTIKILSMCSDLSYDDRTGIVRMIDDLGQLHGTWGESAVNPEIDDYFVLHRS